MAIASVTLVTDTPGRVLTGVAALGLILFASATWRARPRLAITPDGLAIRGWFRTQLLRHSNIKIIRIDEFRRYGLEIASTTRCDSASITSPKMVWRRFRCGVLPTVMKNCEPLVARTGVGHREQIGLVELQLGVELVGELVAGSAATRPGWIATLDHEALDHPVKDRAVVERAGRAT